MKSFGPRLRELRESRGLSQRKLAELIGGEAMQISRYESGTNLPAAESIVRLAEVLHVTTDELLTGKKPETDPVQVRHLGLLERLRLVDQLPRKDIEAAINVLDAFVARHEFTDVAARRLRQSA